MIRILSVPICFEKYLVKWVYFPHIWRFQNCSSCSLENLLRLFRVRTSCPGAPWPSEGLSTCLRIRLLQHTEPGARWALDPGHGRHLRTMTRGCWAPPWGREEALFLFTVKSLGCDWYEEGGTCQGVLATVTITSLDPKWEEKLSDGLKHLALLAC